MKDRIHWKEILILRAESLESENNWIISFLIYSSAIGFPHYPKVEYS